MRHRRMTLRYLLVPVCCLLLGLAAGLTMSAARELPLGLAASDSKSNPTSKSRCTTKSKRTSCRPRTRVIIRGRRGLRGLRGMRGRQGPQGPSVPGPQGPGGPAGAPGAAGPAGPADDAVRSLTLNWRRGQWGGRDSAATETPGLGTVIVTCRPGTLELRVAPSTPGARTVLDTTVFQGAGTAGASSHERRASSGPGDEIRLPLPVNGMLTGTLSVEPVAGDGGPGPSPASLIVSSEAKLNGASNDENFCYLAAQVVGRGR